MLGGFTTFSAFSLDAVLLWERGDAGLAAAYVAASVVLSIGGLVAGLALSVPVRSDLDCRLRAGGVTHASHEARRLRTGRRQGRPRCGTAGFSLARR